jgi:hypothetical protein
VTSVPRKPTSTIILRSILMLFSHMQWSLINGLYPSGFPINILYAFLTLMSATCITHLILQNMISLITFGEE